jgi:AraC family transcriptional activator of mtrCDE
MNAKKYTNDAQKYGVDAFSQILHLLKLDANVYFNAKVCGNWRINEHTLEATCFHMVTVGSCVLDVPGLFSGVLNCGDLVIFPRELTHSMVPAKDALPPVFVIRYDASNSWLRSLLEMIVTENMCVGPASKALLDKLSELLFTYALRQYLTDNPGKVGMLAIYSHPRLAHAIDAVHQHPEHEWTLEFMAKEAALSRTTFVETFKAVSGWTPGQYLTWWRMQLAWSLLKDGESSAEVANKVGYKSESAFSRAFQKMFSMTAGKVRRGAA